MSKILIIGAKGFAGELFEAVMQRSPDADVTFFDSVSDDLPGMFFGKYPIIRTTEAAAEYFRSVNRRFALGVGTPELRSRFFREFIALGGEPETIISPFAKVGIHSNRIGAGCCVLTDAVVESNNTIGEGCLIHVGVLISHDVTLGDFCEVSPRANLLGAVRIGSNCTIGTAATILPGITVGNNVTVGAGAVVTKNVDDGQTVAGVPARPLIP